MIYHKELAEGKWFNLSLPEQMANIGSEVLRCIKWKKKDEKIFLNTFEKAMELFYLTITDPKNKKRLKEICRIKELFCDFVFGENKYFLDEKFFENYFNWFAYYVRKKEGFNVKNNCCFRHKRSS